MNLDQQLNLTRETQECKKIDDDVMSPNGDVFVFLPIYRQFATIWKSDSGRVVYKTYIFINN